MHKDIFDSVLKSTIPESGLLTGVVASKGRPAPQETRGENYRASVESGTTVLAFHFKDGIMLAGDRQTSSWFSIISQESVKIYPVGLYSAFMYAGLVGDGQTVTKVLRSINRDFISRFGIPLSLEGQANFLSNFVRMYYNYGIFLEAWGIISGLNLNPLEFKIYSVEPTGCKMSQDFAVTGSGQERADSELEKFKGKIKLRSLSFDEAITLAVRAIYASGKKDMGTSDVRLALPLVATISLDGFRFSDSRKVEEIRDKLIEQERRKGNVV